MKKIKDQISDVLYERLASPFAQSFLIAWIAVNWKLLLFIFSSWDDDFDYRLARIDQYLGNVDYWNTFFYPLMLSFVALGFYIFASYWAYDVWERFRKAKKESRANIEESTIVTEEDASFLREQIAQTNSRIRELIKSNTDDVQRLENEKNDLVELHKKETDSLNERIKSIKDKIPQEEGAKKNKSIHNVDSKTGFTLMSKSERESRIEDLNFRADNAYDLINALSKDEVNSILGALKKVYNSNDGSIDSDLKADLIKLDLIFYDGSRYRLTTLGGEFRNHALKQGF